MDAVMLIAGVIVLISLVAIVSLRVPRSQYSEFELQRRRDMGDAQALFGLKRLRALAGLLTLQTLMTWVLLVIDIILSILLLGWGWGLLTSLLIVLLVGPVARLGFVRRSVQRLYRKYENGLIGFVLSYKKILRLLAPPIDTTQTTELPSSREELEHVIRESRSLVTHDEAALIMHGLKFFGRTVDAIMTPISEVTTVESGELLGPLVLDDLHRTGHTLFPVTNGEEVVGLLDITDSVGLRSHESPSVRDTMRHEMIRIAHDEPLDEALKILIDVKQPCLLVMGDEQEVVGLISLGDVVRALTGWTRRH